MSKFAFEFSLSSSPSGVLLVLKLKPRSFLERRQGVPPSRMLEKRQVVRDISAYEYA